MSRSRFVVLAVATLAVTTPACSAILDWSDFTGGSTGAGMDAGLDGDAATTDSSSDRPAMGSDAADSASLDVVVSCGSGGVCAPTAPSGWTGPVALYAGSGAAPACSGGASSLFDGMGNLTASPATCSSCSCGAATASCTDPVVSVYEAASCSGTATATITATPSCSSPSAELLAALVSVSAPALTGSCASGTSMATLPTPTWGTVARACPVTGGSGCSGGATCIGAQPTSTSVCLMQAGAATTCPSGYPSGPQVFYTGVDDTRGCSACTCAAPAGATCSIASPAIQTYQDPTCTTPEGTLSAPNGCTAVEEVVSLELIASPMLSGTASCSVSGGGMPTGMAIGSSATAMSFCCLP